MNRGLPRPTLCLVTARERVQPAGTAGLLRLIAHAASAGVDLIQLREPGLTDAALFDLTSAAVRAVEGTGSRLVVNDRIDVALASGADGVHLRADSITVGQVRKLVPAGFLVGRSVHSAAEAVLAAGDGADYVIAGTVYPTRSKPSGAPVLGIGGLSGVVRATDLPVLAIGGVGADTVEDVARAGVAGLAAIGVFADVPTDVSDDRLDAALRALVARLRSPFASGRPGR